MSTVDQPHPADVVRTGLLALNETLSPFREWLAGNVEYFRNQGYSEEQARHLAVTEYRVFLPELFGTKKKP